MKVVLSVFLMLTFALPTFGIIGGKRASRGQFPSTVFILNTMCTGVKVGPRHYLSARHCGSLEAGEKLNIQWKITVDFKAPSLAGETANLTVRNSYTQKHGNLTLFEVEEEIRSLPPAKIRMKIPALGDQVTINGYGCTDPLGYKYPYDPKYFPFDQKFSPKQVSNTNGLFIDVPYLDPDGKGKSSICYVDSGGALYGVGTDGHLELVGIAEYTSTTETGEITSSFNRVDEDTVVMPGELSAGAWLKKVISGQSF